MGVIAQPPTGGGGAGFDGGSSAGGGAGEPHGDEPGRDRLARLYTLVRDLVGRRSKNVSAYVSREVARGVARQRLLGIEQRVEGFRFLEVPPGVFGRPQRYEGRSAHLLETILLERECTAPELLLLGRVGDAVESVLRARSYPPSAAGFNDVVDRVQPVVALRPLPRLLRGLRRDLYPWRVVVRTTDKAAMARLVRGIDAWLGIGVDVVRAGRRARMQPLAACRVGGGREGTVGGELADGNGWRVQVTSAHVLAPGCISVLWRPLQGGDSPDVIDEPDAALLKDPSCFGSGFDRRRVSCAEHEDLVRAMGERRALVHNGRSGGRGWLALAPGAVSAPGASLYRNPNGEGVCRFPVVEIRPHRVRRGPLPWPLLRRPFSREGDSGSWVLEQDADRWIGLVVCGEPRSSLALQAAPLVEYLRRIMLDPQAEVECWARS